MALEPRARTIKKLTWRSDGSPHFRVGNPWIPCSSQSCSPSEVQSISAMSWFSEPSKSAISLSQSGFRALQCPHLWRRNDCKHLKRWTSLSSDNREVTNRADNRTENDRRQLASNTTYQGAKNFKKTVFPSVTESKLSGVNSIAVVDKAEERARRNAIRLAVMMFAYLSRKTWAWNRNVGTSERLWIWLLS